MFRPAQAFAMAFSLVVADCSRDVEPDAAPSEPPSASAAHAAPIYPVPTAGLPSLGNARGKVTLVVFTDYECPFCRKLEKTLARLRTAYGNDLHVVVAERPLPMHPRARPAALAALAAAEQGKLGEMHAALFASGALDDASIEAIARGIGLDLARFDADRTGAAARALKKSEDLADAFDVQGTPTMFINGQRVVGAQPFEALKQVIDERLAVPR
jgi:protein-disulfide isomerase